MARGNSTLTADRLKRELSYDPLSGLFHWLKTGRGRKVGQPAGSIEKKASGISYVRIGLFGRYYYAQRLAVLYMTGEWPEGEVDHDNKNGIDNRWTNLRDATRSQNQGNTSARKGTKGVHRDTKSGMYVAQISINGRSTYLGSFLEEWQAAQVYRNAARQHFGEFHRE